MAKKKTPDKPVIALAFRFASGKWKSIDFLLPEHGDFEQLGARVRASR